MAREAFVQDLITAYDNWSADRANRVNQAGGSGQMTSALYPYDTMFSPIQINRTTIKNRIVMAPMGNISMAEETGRPNDMMLNYFFARAKGGAGLLTTGLVPTSHGVDATVTELDKLSYFPRIDRSRTVFSGWRDLAQGVHAYGAKIFIQLTAGLGRVGNPQVLLTQLKFPRSASLLPNFYIPAIPCLRFSGRQLKKIVKNTGQAAADAHAMGLDGVYLHGHEGYLLEQLANPAFNHRRIGRYADWRRFGLDTITEIRQRVGPNYPIMYRIDLSLALEECYDEATRAGNYLRKLTGGRSVEQTLDYMAELVAAGVDIFDVDLGCYDNWWLPHPPASMPAGCFLPVARLAKDYFAEHQIRSNAGLAVPIVGVGKLGYPDIAETALRQGDCDMVMLGRPLLADPEWPNKTYAGQVTAIRPCIGCQEACLNEFVEGGHPQCAVNPRSSFEYLLPEIPAPATAAKRVAVVGSGPAGTITALTAASRGHQVDLYEKTAELGGRLVPGSQPAIKFDLDNYRQYLNNQIQIAQQSGRLRYRAASAADAQNLKAQGYDTIVCAIGTVDAVPPVPGLQVTLPAPGPTSASTAVGSATPALVAADPAALPTSPPTIQAVALLQHPELLAAAQRVLVVGGGAVGCETAHWLAYEQNRQVTVIEMLNNFMEGVCTANRTHLLHALKAKNVQLLNMTRLVGVEPSGVRVSRNHGRNVPDPYITWTPLLPENIVNPLAPKIGADWREESIATDLIVLATGGRADDSLYFDCLRLRSAAEIYNIGDSFSPGLVQAAVRGAYRLGSSI